MKKESLDVKENIRKNQSKQEALIRGDDQLVKLVTN